MQYNYLSSFSLYFKELSPVTFSLLFPSLQAIGKALRFRNIFLRLLAHQKKLVLEAQSQTEIRAPSFTQDTHNLTAPIHPLSSPVQLSAVCYI
jgi:hypothetical protein